jgi:hypothetical protein
MAAYRPDLSSLSRTARSPHTSSNGTTWSTSSSAGTPSSAAAAPARKRTPTTVDPGWQQLDPGRRERTDEPRHGADPALDLGSPSGQVPLHVEAGTDVLHPDGANRPAKDGNGVRSTYAWRPPITASLASGPGAPRHARRSSPFGWRPERIRPGAAAAGPHPRRLARRATRLLHHRRHLQRAHRGDQPSHQADKASVRWNRSRLIR